MSVLELARKYYPRLWDKARLEALVSAGRLTEEEMEELIHDGNPTGGGPKSNKEERSI